MSLLLYARAFGYGYVRADDVDLVLRNQAFLSDPVNAPRVFGQAYFDVAGAPGPKTYYRPLVVLSFMLDAQIGGPEPLVYHATNVILHVLVTFLVYALARRVGAGERAALMAALLFSAHPLNVQAVAWIVGRNDVLMSAFACAALLALDRFRGGGTSRAAAIHLACFGLALFTKETAALLPLLFGLFLWWRGWSWNRPQGAVLGVGYAALAGLWLGLRQAALEGPGQASDAGTSVAGVLRNLPDLLLYLGKTVFPLRLSIMPAADPAGLLLGVAAIGVIGALFWRGLGPRDALFASAWTLGFIAPALLVRGLPAYEHRMYFPLIGLAIGGSLLREPLPSRWMPAVRTTAGFLLAGFIVLTTVRLPTFAHAFSYWEDAAGGGAYAPIAHVNLGSMEEELGNLDAALGHYRRALALDPETPNANNNIGVVMTKLGRLDDARRYFERETTVNPGNASAHYNLGLYYKTVGRPDEAPAYWRKAIELNRYYVDAYEELVMYYEGRGRADEAAPYRERLRELTR